MLGESLACGLSQTLDQLIDFRVLQGVGAGLVTPVVAAMLYRAYSMEDRAKAAIGVLRVAVIAPAIGPMLGGILVDTASWHWIFMINGSIGAVAIVLSFMWLEETKHEAPGSSEWSSCYRSTFRACVVAPRSRAAWPSRPQAITCHYATADLTTPLSTIAGFSLLRGLAVGLVFVSIQTAVYATTSMADIGRATSLFNAQRQVAYASGVALAATSPPAPDGAVRPRTRRFV